MDRPKRRIPLMMFALTLCVATVVCGQEKSVPGPEAKPEIVSLLGVKYYAKADVTGDIAKAESQLAADPKNVELLLAVGRAQAAAWRYHDAIATYTRALETAPADARLYRQRGHRYISVRRFDAAVADLKRAALLNDRDFDIWYHLGLAHYLRGEFTEALAAYQKCHDVAQRDRIAAADKEGRDDKLIAISDWLYMTYRRLNRPADAAKILEPITPESKVKENKSYFKRLLFYKGLTNEEELIKPKEPKDFTDSELATVGYGLGNWHLYNGNRAKAEEHFRRIVSGKFWPAFGFIAAEVELARK
jgi:tetratricopeptide (TPR) repeat protein